MCLGMSPHILHLFVMPCRPDMSGYEVCQEIRRRYASLSIPIIMVSAKGHPEHVMKVCVCASMSGSHGVHMG